MSQQEQVVKWSSWLRQEGGVGRWSARLGCRASCWELPQPDVWADTAGKELPTQWCSGINLLSVMQEWVMTILPGVSIPATSSDIQVLQSCTSVFVLNKHSLTLEFY